MKTLLIRSAGEPPSEVRDIVRAGSTELQEMDELRPEAAVQADRVVIWRDGEVEVRGGADVQGTASSLLKWPQDEDKLRLYFQTTA
jgi:hypothetical protein